MTAVFLFILTAGEVMLHHHFCLIQIVMACEAKMVHSVPNALIGSAPSMAVLWRLKRFGCEWHIDLVVRVVNNCCAF